MCSRAYTLRYSYVSLVGLLWPLASCSNESGFKAGKVPTNSQFVKAEEQESFKRSLGFRFVEADGKRSRARGRGVVLIRQRGDVGFGIGNSIQSFIDCVLVRLPRRRTLRFHRDRFG